MTTDRDDWPPEGYVIFDDHPTAEVLARATQERSVVCCVVLFSRTDDICTVRDAWVEAHSFLPTIGRVFVYLVPESIGTERAREVFMASVRGDLFHVLPLRDCWFVCNLLLSDEVAGHDPILSPEPWSFKTLEGVTP